MAPTGAGKFFFPANSDLADILAFFSMDQENQKMQKVVYVRWWASELWKAAISKLPRAVEADGKAFSKCYSFSFALQTALSARAPSWVSMAVQPNSGTVLYSCTCAGGQFRPNLNVQPIRKFNSGLESIGNRVGNRLHPFLIFVEWSDAIFQNDPGQISGSHPHLF